MSRIDEMIRVLCPEGVEIVKLGDVCSFVRGKTITEKNAIEGNIPVIAGGQKPSYFHNEYNKDGESITVAGSGAYAGFVSFWNIPIWVSDAFTVEPNDKAITKYVYYLLLTKQQRIFETQKGAGVPHVHGKDIANFEIPLPPLSIQQEIVSVLDSFTTLIDKMKQEVEKRKKQMEYYRESMINEICGYDKAISDFTNVLRGRRLTKNMLSNDNAYPVYHGGNVPIGYYNEANRKAKTVMIINVGASAGTVGFCNEDFWSSDGCFCLEKQENAIDKYVYYALKSKERGIMSLVRTAGIPTLDSSAVEKVSIPLPSIEKQSYIVSTLDKLESYISKLEKMVTLRQKQYEYYREKLLTFE